MAKLKWYGKYCELLKIQLWCMHGFLTNIYFCNNIHNWSYILCSANQKLGKSGRWTNYATPTGNAHKTFSFEPIFLFCPCVVLNATAYVDTKALYMRHQSKKHFLVSFFVISQHQKGYLFYVPITHKIFSSHEIVFDKKFLVR